MGFETPLHAAKNLGSAKSGVHHWIAQRVSAIALIPLGLWFVYSFICLSAAPYEQTREWLASPWTGTAAILLIVFMFYHGYLGLKVVLEDYVSSLSLRWALIIIIKLFSIAIGLLAIISILTIMLHAQSISRIRVGAQVASPMSVFLYVTSGESRRATTPKLERRRA